MMLTALIHTLPNTALTSGSESTELGGVSLCVRSSAGWLGLPGPVLGGGRWKSLAWSC